MVQTHLRCAGLVLAFRAAASSSSQNGLSHECTQYLHRKNFSGVDDLADHLHQQGYHVSPTLTCSRNTIQTRYLGLRGALTPQISVVATEIQRCCLSTAHAVVGVLISTGSLGHARAPRARGPRVRGSFAALFPNVPETALQK